MNHHERVCVDAVSHLARRLRPGWRDDRQEAEQCGPMLFVGDVLLDAWCPIDSYRGCPEECAVDVTCRERAPQYLPGGSANAARQVAQCGVDRMVMGIMDEEAVKVLASFGMGVNPILGAELTPRKLRYAHQGKTVFRVSQERPCFGLTTNGLIWRQNMLLERVFNEVEKQKEAGRPYRAAVLSDYLKGSLSPFTLKTIACGLAETMPVVIDAKLVPAVTPFPKNVILKLSEQDLRSSVLRRQMPGDSKEDILRGAFVNMMATWGCPVVITRGPLPPLLFPASGWAPKELTGVTACKPGPHPFQPSGAGDTFSAWLAFALAHGLNHEEAVLIAYAAATVGGSTGILRSPPLMQELHTCVDRQSGRLLSLNEARQWLLYRSLGKVAVTNGVFDLLHPGHYQLLRHCRTIADHTLVLINSDASARRLKGRDPILDEYERARMLADVEGVDGVIVFDSDTPAEAIRLLSASIHRPIDFLVKGAEYAGRPIAGAEHCKTLSFAPMYSNLHTSLLREKMRHVAEPEGYADEGSIGASGPSGGQPLAADAGAAGGG